MNPPTRKLQFKATEKPIPPASAIHHRPKQLRIGSIKPATGDWLKEVKRWPRWCLKPQPVPGPALPRECSRPHQDRSRRRPTVGSRGGGMAEGGWTEQQPSQPAASWCAGRKVLRGRIDLLLPVGSPLSPPPLPPCSPRLDWFLMQERE